MPRMKVDLFDCDVRLGGGLLHSVPKKSVHDRELRMLKLLHGPESVINVKKVGEAEVDEFAAMMDLAAVYGPEKVGKAFNYDMSLFGIWQAERVDEAEAKREQKRLEAAETERRQAADKKAVAA